MSVGGGCAVCVLVVVFIGGLVAIDPPSFSSAMPARRALTMAAVIDMGVVVVVGVVLLEVVAVGVVVVDDL